MADWKWLDSFVVKDAIGILQRAMPMPNHAGRPPEFTTSFHSNVLADLTDVMFDCPEKPAGFKFEVKEPVRLYDSICLTSGGADSTIAWFYANKPQGLYIDVGQKYAQKEIEALKSMEIPYHYVDLRGTHIGDRTWKHIIPGRNFLFLAVAAEMVKDHGNIWFAMVEGEGADSDKGDKSFKFLNLFQEWYTSCTGRHVYVQTMTTRTKAGWLQWFQTRYSLDIIRWNTVTCFSGDKGQCGACQSCLRKYLSFMSLGLDTAADFVTHPMFGCAEYVIKYKRVLAEALDKQTFTHYSQKRCQEDLAAIVVAENLILSGQSQ